MSRLIDADAMKQHYPIMENDFGMVFNEGLHKELDKEPTVKAIPLDKVEQIREEILNKAFSIVNPSKIHECINVIDLESLDEIIDKALKEQTNEN